MSFVLNNMGYNVLVNDLSRSRKMADIISYSDFSEDISTYRNVDFNFSGEELEGYDYVIYYYDDWSEDFMKKRADFIIINIQVFKSELNKFRKVISRDDTDTIIVIRDKAGDYLSKKYISKYVINGLDLFGLYEIKMDCHDKAYQYKMDYDGINKLKYLSDNYCDVLIKIVCSITGKGREYVRKSLKNVKGGRVFDNRLLE